jgi:hypothetical protein
MSQPSGEPKPAPNGGALLSAAVALCAVAAPVAAKIGWASEVAWGARAFTPVVGLPLWLGADLLVAAAVIALSRALQRGLRGVPLLLSLSLGLAAWSGLHVVSHMSFLLTGSGVTWQRFRGDEGATLLDLELLHTPHLVLGGALLAAGVAAFPLLLLLARRVPLLAPLGAPRVALILAVLGGGLTLGARLAPVYGYDLEETPALLLARTWVFPSGTESLTPVALTDGEWDELMRARNVGALPAPAATEKLDNAVLFLAEGIPERFTSFGQGGFAATPNLARRAAREGVRFSRFYSPYHSSIQALFSVACASYPSMDPSPGPITSRNPRVDCGELSDVLAPQDVAVGLFHGGQFGYYDKLAFFGGRGYEALEDAEVLRRRWPDRWTNKWGIDDRAVVDAALAWIDSLPPGQRFVALVVPITAHYPWKFPDDVKPAFGRDTGPARFSSAVHFLDGAFERLVTGLEERDRYASTLVAWTADHGERVQRLSHKTVGHRAFYEQSLRVPLVLLNPTLFGALEERVSARPGSLIDFVPTTLDALGLEPHPRHQGQSLLGPAWEPRRVFFGARTGRQTFVGFVDGDEKVSLRVSGRIPELYDLASDPLERDDRSDADPARTERLVDDALRFLLASEARVGAMPQLADGPELQTRALASAQVSVERGGVWSPCQAAGDAGHACEADGEVHAVAERRRRVRKGLAGNARCLEVELPAAGSTVKIALRDREVLRRLSSVRVARPRELPTGGSIRLRVVVDGELRHRKSFRPHTKPTWLPLPLAEESIELELTRAGEGEGPACLLLSNVAWKG